MEKITDRRLDYTDRNGRKALCRLRIYEEASKIIVLFTEFPDNPGMSITNFIEGLAKEVYLLLERPAREIVWVEHYLPYADAEEHFDLVEFASYPPVFLRPDWTPLILEQVEKWTGDNMKV